MCSEIKSLSGLMVYVSPSRNWVAELRDILKEVSVGEEFYWSILAIEGVGVLGTPNIEDLEKISQELTHGYVLSWKELNFIADKIEQVYDGIFIGSKDLLNIRNYKTFREMFETCDYAFVMFDCAYWYIFSKDSMLQDKLVKKFTEVKHIRSDEEDFCY